MAVQLSSEQRSPHPLSPRSLLQAQLHDLADALADAQLADHSDLRRRTRRAIATYRTAGMQDVALCRLLENLFSDLSAKEVALDALYYARQLVVHVDRISY